MTSRRQYQQRPYQQRDSFIETLHAFIDTHPKGRPHTLEILSEFLTPHTKSKIESEIKAAGSLLPVDYTAVKELIESFPKWKYPPSGIYECPLTSLYVSHLSVHRKEIEKIFEKTGAALDGHVQFDPDQRKLLKSCSIRWVYRTAPSGQGH
jgi:hypothetical protein